MCEFISGISILIFLVLIYYSIFYPFKLIFLFSYILELIYFLLNFSIVLRILVLIQIFN